MHVLRCALKSKTYSIICVEAIVHINGINYLVFTSIMQSTTEDEMALDGRMN